jgi:hypothetical protein
MGVSEENDLDEVHKMLLRHNSSLRIWYKLFCSKYENTIGEDAFSMDL